MHKYSLERLFCYEYWIMESKKEKETQSGLSDEGEGLHDNVDVSLVFDAWYRSYLKKF